ncbi:hypothetical protein GBAR_LOCUS3336 [Geodia barretti]|uniref:Uncharacterized protein n=1 Tax=Geodia barretti TaxID=519541 RepID=A0AA35W8F2_GEOBA|nr:hypothetical protein GBAR_LOCUS3336 [Geodia barretti]
MWRPSVSKTAEMYHDASSGFSRTTNFSTALAEVYEAHLQEVAAPLYANRQNAPPCDSP